MEKFLHEMANEMVSQNNRGTSCPLWLVFAFEGHHFPRVFFTAAKAEAYRQEQGGTIFITSCWASGEMKAVMQMLLDQAGVAEKSQAYNAYEHPAGHAEFLKDQAWKATGRKGA